MSGDDMIKLYWKTVSILLAGIVLVALGLYFGKGIKKESQEIESEPAVTESVEVRESLTELSSESVSESVQEENPLLQDALFEINKLMEWFFQAKFDCDIETLQQIVSPNDGYSAERLYEERYGKDESGLLEIESYQVKSCYSKNGLTDGTYLVWVLVDIKYVHAAAAAPALYRMYVCRGENGYFIDNDISEEEAVYRDEISQEADVQELIAEVNQRFQEAVDQDEQLKEIVLAMDVSEFEEQSLEETQSTEEIQSSQEE